MTRPTESREPHPTAGRSAAAMVVSAVGTIALTALTLGKIPLSDWNRVPATPFDFTYAGEAVQVHLFLNQAADHLPLETTVAITSEPRDPVREERLRSYARALLPGRRLVSDPAVADETVVFGGRPVSADSGFAEAPAAQLLFETPYGRVWANPRDGAPRTKRSDRASRTGLTWLLSLGLFPLAGTPLLSHPAFRPIGFAARAVLSAACGTAILSTVATLSSLAGIPWSPLGLLVVSAGAAFALRWAVGHSRAAEKQQAALPLRSRVLWGALSGVAVAAALDVTAVGGATSVDMILQWGFKAQAFAAARGFDAALLGNSANDVNRAYPPLVPAVEAFATMLSGRFPWGAATLVFPLLLVLLALSLPRLLARGGRCDLAFAGAALAVAVMAYAGVRHEIAGNGDMPLWFFEALAAVVLSVPLGGERTTCILGGLLLAGAATTKIEGFAFSAAAIAIFVAPPWRRRRLRLADFLFLVAPAVLSLGAWFAFGISRRIFSGYGMGPLFGIHWELAGEVLGAVAHELGKAPWPYLAALLFLAACAASRRPAALPIGVAGLLSAFLLFTYLHGTLDPREWIAWSAARVFAPLAMLLILAGAAGSDRPPADTPGTGVVRA